MIPLRENKHILFVGYFHVYYFDVTFHDSLFYLLVLHDSLLILFDVLPSMIRCLMVLVVVGHVRRCYVCIYCYFIKKCWFISVQQFSKL